MVEKNSVPSSSPFRGSVQVLQCSAIPVSESLSKALGAYFYLGKFSSGKFFINNTLTRGWRIRIRKNFSKSANARGFAHRAHKCHYLLKLYFELIFGA